MSWRCSWGELWKWSWLMIIEYAVLSLALNPCRHIKSFMKVFMVLRIHAWETNTHARVNLYEVSIYKSCWRWSVSQFSTCMRLLRHGCQRHSFGNSQADGQMYIHVHFPWPHWSELMNWQFVQIMASKFRSKLRRKLGMAVFMCVNYLLVAKSSATVQNHERKDRIPEPFC